MSIICSVTRIALGSVFLFALEASLAAQCLKWEKRFEQHGVNGNVDALAVFDDGQGPALYAGGTFTLAGAQPAARVARWDGSSWSALGSGFASSGASVRALCVYDDGSGPALYAAGQLGPGSTHVRRWDGTSWLPLGSGVSSVVSTLCVYDDGSGPALYAGGLFTLAGGVPASRIARWDGSTWSALGSGVSGSGPFPAMVDALIVHDDGSGPALIAGGVFTNAGGVPVMNVARWDGASWSAMGAGFQAPGICADFEVFDDGSGPELYAAGDFTLTGAQLARHIARWDGSQWIEVGGGIDGPSDKRIIELAVFDDGSGPALYAGGIFATAGATPALNIARWDGANWSAVGPGLSASVGALAGFDGGNGLELHAGGGLDSSGSTGLSGIGAWDGAEWRPLAYPNHGEGSNGAVVSLVAFDDGSGPSVFATGDFTVIGATPALSRAARWDGLTWSALPGLLGYQAKLFVADLGGGPELYVGNDTWLSRWNGASSVLLPGAQVSTTIHALAAYDPGSGAALYVAASFPTGQSGIARYTGSGWQSVGSGLTGGHALALANLDLGNGAQLYAGGAFTFAGGSPANQVASWNGTAWSPLGVGVNGHVHALLGFDDGTGPALYAAGAFTQAGGAPASRIARWNGSSWSAVGAGFDQLVVALEVFDDGSGPALYAIGDFTTSGTTPVERIARWDGANWTSLGAGVDGSVKTLTAFDDGVHRELWFGGQFNHAAALDSSNVAAWRACEDAIEPFCFGDGSLWACPCGNQGLPGHGCDNSIANGGARLVAFGGTQPDTLMLQASGELPAPLSIFLQGNALAAGVTFGDGLRCAGGTLVRLYIKAASGGTAVAPGPGDPSVSARSAAQGDPITSGETRYYQTYYRDADPSFCAAPPGSTWNVTNALRIVW